MDRSTRHAPAVAPRHPGRPPADPGSDGHHACRVLIEALDFAAVGMTQTRLHHPRNAPARQAGGDT